jgi:hypothetical protein
LLLLPPLLPLPVLLLPLLLSSMALLLDFIVARLGLLLTDAFRGVCGVWGSVSCAEVPVGRAWGNEWTA